jgi:hypothetical protein
MEVLIDKNGIVDVDKIDWEAYFKDCESICFDCGEPDPQHKLDDGVALCDFCKRGYDATEGE